MKKFTIVASALFILLFCGMVGFVAMSEDFVAPAKENKTVVEENMNSPVWGKTFDELVVFLEEKNLIDSETEQLLGNAGLCSRAVKYNGAEIYWWDLDALDENSEEYKAYDSLRKKGEIDLWGTGSIITPVKNGPFALLLTYYDGDVNALEKAFSAFGQEE